MTRRALSLIGKRFGRLVVIEKTIKRSGTSVMWLCQCDCGKVKEINGSSLIVGATQSCGCLRSENRINNLKGKRFNKLLVLEELKERQKNKIVWRCLCDCGTYIDVISGSLVTGLTQSCGCYKTQRTSEIKRKDITNQRFGRLVALEPLSSSQQGVKWKCICDCGKYAYASCGTLTSGHTQSCGCLYCKGSVYLYAFESRLTGYIKIGISGNVLRRRKELEKGLKDDLLLLGYVLSSRAEEVEIHNKLIRYRAIHPNQPEGREWFHPRLEVIDKVNQIKDKQRG